MPSRERSGVEGGAESEEDRRPGEASATRRTAGASATDRTDEWTDTLAYGGDRAAAISEPTEESDHWDRWHYGLYLGSALLAVGALRVSLPLLLAGWVLVPTTMYLDSRYLESVTPGWQADTGLHLVGSLLFPVVMAPAYLYRRRELRGPNRPTEAAPPDDA